MRLSLKAASLLICSLALSACSEGESGITFEDYRARVISVAGPGADDCGEAAIGEGANQNECVAIAFANGFSSYAIYNLQGADSQVATAYAVNAQGNVFRLLFDSDPTGGGLENNGEISIFQCLNPRLSGVTDNPEVSVFICDQVAS